MMWIAAGFLACCVASFWLAARVGAKRGSAGMGMLAGLLGFVVLLGAYGVGLTLWTKALLTEFIETELPMILTQLTQLFERIVQLKEPL